MFEIDKEQVRRVHGKDGIGIYEQGTGQLIDRYNNHIDIWGNLLDANNNIIGKTKDSNY